MRGEVLEIGQKNLDRMPTSLALVLVLEVVLVLVVVIVGSS